MFELNFRYLVDREDEVHEFISKGLTDCPIISQGIFNKM